jgi:hypothetical protein
MIRVLLAAVALAVLPLGSWGEETPVRLSVQPMAAPKPALKYLLLPEVRELNPGNPVQWYIRSFQEQRNFYFSKAATAERARYRTMPLADLPGDKLRHYGGFALRQADWAARLDTPDWEVLQRVQSGGKDLRLPELGPLQIMATALQVRFRGAVAGRRFDDAVHTAKTMFALARHLGECPAGAANLVGLSTAGLALDTLEEMVQQPGCPNLYWALTDLPCPLVDVRKGMQGDRVLAGTYLRGLRNEPMTEAELEEVVSRLSGALGFVREQAGLPPRSLRAVVRAGVKDPARLCAARNRLIEAAGAEKPSVGQALRFLVRVQYFPPAQLILLDEKRAFEVRRDERMKLLALAPWQIDLVGAGDEAGGGPFDALLPDVVKVRRMQARLEQRIALLRHVEALRLYAAAHAGKLPAQLSDCGVPLPADPFTGKPFRYQVDGATAHLRGSPAHRAHYQVTIRTIK